MHNFTVVFSRLGNWEAIYSNEWLWLLNTKQELKSVIKAISSKAKFIELPDSYAERPVPINLKKLKKDLEIE